MKTNRIKLFLLTLLLLCSLAVLSGCRVFPELQGRLGLTCEWVF